MGRRVTEVILQSTYTTHWHIMLALSKASTAVYLAICLSAYLSI